MYVSCDTSYRMYSQQKYCACGMLAVHSAYECCQLSVRMQIVLVTELRFVVTAVKYS